MVLKEKKCCCTLHSVYTVYTEEASREWIPFNYGKVAFGSSLMPVYRTNDKDSIELLIMA